MRTNVTIEAPNIPKKLGVKYKKMLKIMPPGTQQVYCLALCGVCKQSLERSDLEWCLDNEFLPVCEKDRAEAQERVAKLWGHMGQLNLL